MKIIPGITVCILIILASCSPYRKVSSSSFKEYGIHEKDVEQLHFVLKKRDLHYSSEAGQNIYNTYNKQDGSLSDSQRVLLENNIVIPKGAHGTFVGASNDQLLIDFGEGVIIPFKVYGNDNSPATRIVVDRRSYGIVVTNRTASLYFDVNNHTNINK